MIDARGLINYFTKMFQKENFDDLIFNMIFEAANRGKYEIRLPLITPLFIKRLENLGYEVTFDEEKESINISWKNASKS